MATYNFSKMIRFFTKLQGRDYLSQLINPLLVKVDNATVEVGDLCFALVGSTTQVDPLRIGTGESVEQNLQNLKQVCSEFIDTLVQNASSCPK